VAVPSAAPEVQVVLVRIALALAVCCSLFNLDVTLSKPSWAARKRMAVLRVLAVLPLSALVEQIKLA
jgi:hypothetical protein